ncbi:hypothetical protein C8J57DRAFT_1577777 [Mycena rebaudengoi]|nr:hypothetical protein C8J57DRAFT_1577777 [Mycena rebaudengoi]
MVFWAQLDAQLDANSSPAFSPGGPGKGDGRWKSDGGSWGVRLGMKLHVKSHSISEPALQAARQFAPSREAPPAVKPPPPAERSLNTQIGGEAGMAGVGHRGFVAAARAAIFTANPLRNLDIGAATSSELLYSAFGNHFIKQPSLLRDDGPLRITGILSVCASWVVGKDRLHAVVKAPLHRHKRLDAALLLLRSLPTQRNHLDADLSPLCTNPHTGSTPAKHRPLPLRALRPRYPNHLHLACGPTHRALPPPTRRPLPAAHAPPVPKLALNVFKLCPFSMYAHGEGDIDAPAGENDIDGRRRPAAVSERLSSANANPKTQPPLYSRESREPLATAKDILLPDPLTEDDVQCGRYLGYSAMKQLAFDWMMANPQISAVRGADESSEGDADAGEDFTAGYDAPSHLRHHRELGQRALCVLGWGCQALSGRNTPPAERTDGSVHPIYEHELRPQTDGQCTPSLCTLRPTGTAGLFYAVPNPPAPTRNPLPASNPLSHPVACARSKDVHKGRDGGEPDSAA